MSWRRTVPILVITLLAALGCAAYVGGPPSAPGWYGPSHSGLPPFHHDLSPWGDWLWVDPWGWVWTPWDVEPGWRPYTDGRWVWTDLGWTWVSERPWGWAPFHYGRWTYDPYHGWLWVPGTVWAPAWVAWRQGHGWIGWAPLPPDARWRIGIGLDLGGLDLGLVIVEHGWSFVGERDFVSPRVHRHLAPLPRHSWLMRETRDRTRYEDRDGRVAVRSFGVEELEQGVGAVPRYDIEDMERPPRDDESIHGRAVRVYRPRVPETLGPEPAGPEPVQPQQMPGRKPSEPPPATAQPRERKPAQDERDLKAWERQQQESLEREQKRERRSPPEGETRQQVEQRQKQERQALEREKNREKELQNNRRERREGKQGGSAEGQRPETPPPPGA